MARNRSLYRTAVAAARGPSSHFDEEESALDTGDAVALAMGSAAVWSLLWTLRRTVSGFVLPLVTGEMDVGSMPTMMGISPSTMLALGIVGFLLASLLAGFVVWGVLYAGVTVTTHAAGRWLLGTESFAASAEAVGVAAAVFALAGWLPYVGAVVAPYAGYVGVVGLRGRHGLSTGQAVAMGSPLVLVVALVVLVTLPV